jgi:hypothetical protein
MDSREYEFADITVFIGGQDMLRFRAVSYTKKSDDELLYGKGREPVAIQSGNNSYEGEVGMLQSDYDSLEDAGGGSVTGLRVDIEVTYGNAPEAMRTDRINGAKFNEEKKEMKQGDKFMEVSLPFLCLGIDKNI